MPGRDRPLDEITGDIVDAAHLSAADAFARRTIDQFRQVDLKRWPPTDRQSPSALRVSVSPRESLSANMVKLLEYAPLPRNPSFPLCRGTLAAEIHSAQTIRSPSAQRLWRGSTRLARRIALASGAGIGEVCSGAFARG